MLPQFTRFFTKNEISITDRLTTIEITMPDATAESKAFRISII
jgi:hypothetical protein